MKSVKVSIYMPYRYNSDKDRSEDGEIPLSDLF